MGLPVLFLFFWITLNSRVTVEVVAIGVFLSALMSWFVYRFVGISFAAEKWIWSRIWPVTVFVATLIVEIVKANIQMIKIILSPKMEIHPLILYYKSPVRTDFSKIMLMYSIQLTPGTVLVYLEGNRYGVHAIDPIMTETIHDNEFARMLRKIEGGRKRV